MSQHEALLFNLGVLKNRLLAWGGNCTPSPASYGPDISSCINKECSKMSASKSWHTSVKNITGKQKVPRQWKKVLSVGENKGQLSHFLAKEWRNERYSRKLCGKSLFVSHESECHRICHSAFGIESQLVDCLRTTQEEADTRMFLHVNNISDNGFSKLIVKSTDTDACNLLSKISLLLIVIYYGAQKIKPASLISKRFLTVWGLKDAIKALPGLHALTGCDSISAFVGKGKQAAFKIMHRSEEN